MNKVLIRVVLASVLFGCGSPVPPAFSSQRASLPAGPPPANDTCASPVELTLGVSVIGSTVGAAQDYPCSMGSDVVFSFTAPAAGAYRVSTSQPDAGVAYDVSVVDGTGLCADAGMCTGFSYSLAFRADAGERRQLIASSFYRQYDFSIVVEPLATPVNDTCATPTPLVEGVEARVSFVGAFDDFGPPCGLSYEAADVVMSFTPPVSGQYELSSTVPAFVSAAPCARSCITSSLFDLSAGATYFIVLEAANREQTATVTMRAAPRPSNDTCAAPAPLSPGVPVLGTTRGAADDLCDQGTPDVVYALSSLDYGSFRVSATRPDGGAWVGDAGEVLQTPPQLSVFTGWLCDHSECRSDQTTPASMVIATTPGASRFIVVEARSATDFQLLATPVVAPSNDTCQGARELVIGVPELAHFDTAVDDYPDYSSGLYCGRGGSADVVYAFTAPATGVYELSASNGGELTLSTEPCGRSCGSVPLYGTLTRGTRIYAILEASSGSTTATVVVNAVPAPVNDLCSAAVALTLGQATPGTIRGAGGERCPSTADVFYRFTAPADGTYLITATSTGIFQPAFILSEAACNVSGCQSPIPRGLVRLAAGYTIFLSVSNVFSAPEAFELEVTKVMPPANDTCDGALPLSLGVPLDLSTTNAVDDYQGAEACGRRDFADVVVTFTPPTSGTFVFQASYGFLYLSQGACGRSCDELSTQQTIELTGGVPAYVIVEPYADGAPVTVSVTQVTDGGTSDDAGTSSDGGSGGDAGTDGGTVADAGDGPGPGATGCGCGSGGALAPAALAVLFLLRRRSGC